MKAPLVDVCENVLTPRAGDHRHRFYITRYQDGQGFCEDTALGHGGTGTLPRACTHPLLPPFCYYCTLTFVITVLDSNVCAWGQGQILFHTISLLRDTDSLLFRRP